jgi:SAM-dependent methyltransferase
VVDLGCGRGGFIALLKEQGYRPIGVDTNQAMVADLQQQGFEVYARDALEFLANTPDNSLGGVTALHLVEHFEHKQILALLTLACQKLAPGGFIYLETPNPLCPDSLGRFYADPTHQPVPSRGAFSDERWMTLYQDYGVLATKEKDN